MASEIELTGSLYSNALAIAMDAHKGQVDRAGAPYILHPLTVASHMGTDAGCITALLHDVMEDSDYTEDDLRNAGIPEFILDALRLLTHDKSEPYFDYIQRIRGNELASAVKLADLRHNMDLSRLPKVTEQDLERVEKYRKAMDMLI